jgi:hypothetical protein
MPRHQAPPDIARAGVIGPPISYEWSTDVPDDILWASDEEYPGLARAMTPLSLRAGMALLAATAQWVSWRYSGLVDIDDALQRVEAGYAAAVDPSRVTRFIEGLDWERNRFLPSPQAMLALGFEGEPYRGPVLPGNTA